MANGNDLGVGTYAGPANQGLAQVLGRSLPKPFELLGTLGVKQAQRQQAATKAKTDQINKDREFFQKNFEADFEPLRGDLNQAMMKNTADYMDFATQVMGTTGTPGFSANMEGMLKRQNALKSLHNTATGFGKAIEEVSKTVADNKDLYNEGIVANQLGDATRQAITPEGKLDPRMSTESIEAVYDNPDSYNTAGVVNRFLSNFQQTIETRKQENPFDIDMIKEESSAVMEKNPLTGEWQAKDSDVAFDVAMDDKLFKMKIEQRSQQKAEALNIDDWKVLNRDSYRELVENQAGYKETRQQKFKPTDFVFGRRPSGGAKAITDEDFTFRNQINTFATQPFGPNSELNTPSPQAQSVINDMKGGKIRGMTILDIEAVKGGPPSEFDTERTADNKRVGTVKPYDRYVFKVRGGTKRGQPSESIVEINLTEPNYGEFHGIFNTSPNIQKKIPLSKQVDFNQQFQEEGPDLGF